MRQREVVGAERDSVPEDHERSGAVEVHAEQPVAVAIHHDAAEELGERVGAHEVGGGVLDSQHAGDGLLAHCQATCAVKWRLPREAVYSAVRPKAPSLSPYRTVAPGARAPRSCMMPRTAMISRTQAYMARISAWHVEVAVVVWRREYQVIGALAGLV